MGTGTTTIPTVSLNYSLGDVATSVGNWFGSFWPILAFAAAIPVAFYVAGELKALFQSR
ncbi:hypothetical protein PPSQR21_038370 [Paenibacillus polymyxa SQR-21]|uniref:hypothetical protein n=1 Tax=Paenibacillus polymyxa TaxID=1406 RepID=UPI00042E1908|nr:hypothetical protein [Paenibacillus polymyxa]AHM67475.1 hypothetical protein PPSQR21_038370 [Paenibacillus polymyxa SQR-21]